MISTIYQESVGNLCSVVQALGHEARGLEFIIEGRLTPHMTLRIETVVERFITVTGRIEEINKELYRRHRS